VDAKPTESQWSAYQGLYDWLNQALFDAELRPCLLNFSRHSGAYGFFAPERWEALGAARRTHEISINPSHIGVRSMRETVSTLAHEMVHLWQQEFGQPSRRGYHNQEWAERMISIGLMPSTTGEPGGKTTGQGVSHYVIPGGRFDRAFKDVPEHLLLPWRCRPEGAAVSRGAGSGRKSAEPDDDGAPAEPKSRNKVKYSCPKCGANVWGKPGLRVGCLDDGAVFEVTHDDIKNIQTFKHSSG